MSTVHTPSRWKHLLLAPLMLSLAAVAAPAMADDDDDRRGWRNHGHYDRDRDDDNRHRDRRGDRGRWDRDDDRGHRYYGNRYDRDDRRWERNRYYRAPVRVVHRPVYVNTMPRWARGHDYRSYGYRNVYYVPYNDYGRYGLYRPDYGQRWYRDDRGNFLLVAAATGIIANVLLNHGW